MKIVWAIWFALVVVTFVAYEFYAILNNEYTLSAFMGDLPPYVIFLIGMFFGGLMVHFWGTGKKEEFK